MVFSLPPCESDLASENVTQHRDKEKQEKRVNARCSVVVSIGSRVHQNKLRVSRPRPKRPRLNRFFCGDEIAGDPVRLTLQSPRVPGDIHRPLRIHPYFGAGVSWILEKKTKAIALKNRATLHLHPPSIYPFIPFHKFLDTQCLTTFSILFYTIYPFHTTCPL